MLEVQGREYSIEHESVPPSVRLQRVFQLLLRLFWLSLRTARIVDLRRAGKVYNRGQQREFQTISERIYAEE